MTYFLLSSFLYYRHCRRKTVLPAPFNLVGYLLHYCTKIYDLSKNTGTYIFVVEILYIYSETQCTIANDLIGHIIVCLSNFPFVLLNVYNLQSWSSYIYGIWATMLQGTQLENQAFLQLAMCLVWWFGWTGGTSQV